MDTYPANRTPRNSLWKYTFTMSISFPDDDFSNNATWYWSQRQLSKTSVKNRRELALNEYSIYLPPRTEPTHRPIWLYTIVSAVWASTSLVWAFFLEYHIKSPLANALSSASWLKLRLTWHDFISATPRPNHKPPTAVHHCLNSSGKNPSWPNPLPLTVHWLLKFHVNSSMLQSETSRILLIVAHWLGMYHAFLMQSRIILGHYALSEK